MDVNTITRKAFEEANDVIITWLAVLSRGPAAIEKLDLTASATVLFALRFLFYVAFVDFAIALPFAASSGVRYSDGAYVGISVAAIYVEYLATALILYGALKLFRGKARMEECISAFCLLSAYLPLAAVLRLPMVAIVSKAIDTSANYPQAVSQTVASLSKLTGWDCVVYVASNLLSAAVFAFFLVSVFRSFRRLHALPKARALIAFTLGLIFAFAFAMAIVMPFDGTVDRAFARK